MPPDDLHGADRPRRAHHSYRPESLLAEARQVLVSMQGEQRVLADQDADGWRRWLLALDSEPNAFTDQIRLTPTGLTCKALESGLQVIRQVDRRFHHAIPYTIRWSLD